jgi:hypothetical protein
MATKRQVFISSTAKDLAEFRKAVIEKIELMDDWKCVAMERFGPREGKTVEVCKKFVQECELFLGIVGHFYGSRPKDSSTSDSPTSYTEHEYEAAVTANIHTLMFVARDELKPAPELLVSDSDPERQIRFRQRVLQSGRMSGWFCKDPEDLAARAVAAIRNWERGMPAAEEPRRGRGYIVAKLCNRAKQEMQFWHSFRIGLEKTPGVPQLYFIRGTYSDAPGSLIERLCTKTIQEHVNKVWPTDGVVTPKSVEWPTEGDDKLRCDRLLDRVFSEWEAGIAPAASEEKAGAILAQRIASRKDKVLVTRHDVPTSCWDQAMLASLAWYLGFWDNAAREVMVRSVPVPQCVIFINLIYPHEKPRSRFLRWFRGMSGFNPATLETDLLALLNRRQTQISDTGLQVCPVTLLEPLTCIKAEELMAWFAAYQIFEDRPGERIRRCEEFFSETDCRQMADLEDKLQLIVQEAA